MLYRQRAVFVFLLKGATGFVTLGFCLPYSLICTISTQPRTRRISGTKADYSQSGYLNQGETTVNIITHNKITKFQMTSFKNVGQYLDSTDHIFCFIKNITINNYYLQRKSTGNGKKTFLLYNIHITLIFLNIYKHYYYSDSDTDNGNSILLL